MDIKVLVVDDDPDVRRLIARVLIRHGYQAVKSANGREALGLFCHEKPAIVVTDIRMPDMDGLELLKRLKEEAPEICVVIMTGYGSEAVAIEALRSGASNYFKKPVNVSELIYAIDVLADFIRGRGYKEFDHRKITREVKVIVTGNDVDTIYSMVHELTKAPACFSSDVESIRIGFLEMITNAIEHGNLNITPEEKLQAIQDGTLKELYRNRALTIPYDQRRVTIRYEFTPEKVTYTIGDQGEGFDWRNLPDPRDPGSLMSARGRGILMTRLYMDEVVYNDKGNEVTIVKYLQPCQE